MLEKTLPLVFVILIILLDSYRPASLNQSCSSTNYALSCREVSGKFLEPYMSSEFLSISIKNSDITQISRTHFSSIPEVTVIQIYNSTFLLPKQSNIFNLLVHLKELYIEDCNSTEEIQDMFSTNKELQVLRLSGNKIKTVRKDFVSHLKMIEDLDLSRNEITHIEIGAFEGLPHLRTLNLESNRIGSSFDPVLITLANRQCIVCQKNEETSTSCTAADVVRCRRHQALDQLWWLTHSVDELILNDNPICAVISKTTPVIDVFEDQNESENYNEISRCSVEDKCMKHEIRKVALFSSCGFGRIFDPVSGTESETSVSPKDESVYANADRGSAIYIANIPTAILIGTFIAFVGILIGAALTWMYTIKDKRRTRNSNTEASVPDPGLFQRVVYSASPRSAVVNIQHEVVVGMESESLLSSNADNPLHSEDNTGDLRRSSDTHDNVHPALHNAILLGSLEQLKPLFKNDYRVQNNNGDYSIHVASWGNHHKIVEYLLSRGVDVNIQNNFGDTPLITAARKNHLETSEVLIKHKADCNVSNSNGEIPLHFSVFNGNSDMTRKLLEKTRDFEVADKEGKTALFIAAKAGHIEIVNLLLDKKADVNNAAKDGRTALHAATWVGNLRIVDLLLKSESVILAKDNRGLTPLHNAARKGHIKVVRRLLQCEGVDVNAENISKNTPLHQAAKGGHEEVMKLLLEHGANPGARNMSGFTPMELHNIEDIYQCGKFLMQL